MASADPAAPPAAAPAPAPTPASTRTPAPEPGILARLLARRPVGQVLGLTIGVMFVLAVVGIGLALAANAELTDRRRLVVDHISPAQLAALGLQGALVDQDTATRELLLTGQPQVLQPYREGRRTEDLSLRRLDALAVTGAESSAPALARVRAATDAWRRDFVTPVLRGAPRRAASALTALDTVRFAAVHATLDRLQAGLAASRAKARGQLFDAARVLELTLVLAGGLIVLGLLGAAVILRRVVSVPLGRLGREARRVARGDFHTPLMEVVGAREIAELGTDVDAMRERIVHELSALQAASDRLEEQARELSRSNVELERFAYVASHDLQEPLRKVASFCQALQRRYHGQLDDRADQYIDFAVDGAKRMQILINDLLVFSRVGRSGTAHELLDAAELVAQACTALSGMLEENGAEVVVAPELPTVSGERALLASVFQNLIANAVKFHGPEPPVVRIGARRDDGHWEFSCADNGIGVGPEYAERIFAIFQRLHTKEVYPGTGIGLAMCRKIVERHGGRIWLDTDHPAGACFRFTLPIPEGDQP